MKHLGEKETIDVVITEGQSTKSVVFAETYLVPPCVCIVETDGNVSEATNVTIVGCDINAINSKTDPSANTVGRIIKLSIVE